MVEFSCGREIPARQEMVTVAKNRMTGTHITIEPSDNGEGLWTCICEEHNRCCDFYSKTEARYFAASPVDWCEECWKVWAERNTRIPVAD